MQIKKEKEKLAYELDDLEKELENKNRELILIMIKNEILKKWLLN